VYTRQDGEGGTIMRVVENLIISVLLSGLGAVAALVVTFPVQGDDSDPPSCASIPGLPTSCSESDSWHAVLVAAIVTFLLVMVITTWAGRRPTKAEHPA
jgi:hypothetical protein